MLSRKHGINVVSRGNLCCTDGKTIYIPMIPKHVKCPKLLAKVRAFLDHEVGHIVGKTDMKYFTAMANKHGEAGKFFLNGLEDIRIEQVMIDQYAGCAMNLDIGIREVMKDIADGSADRTVLNPKAAKDKQVTRQEMASHPLKQLAVGTYIIGKGFPLPVHFRPDVVVILHKCDQKFDLRSLGHTTTCTQDMEPIMLWMLDQYKKLRDRREEAGDPVQDYDAGSEEVVITLGSGGASTKMTRDEAEKLKEMLENADHVTIKVVEGDGDQGDEPEGDDLVEVEIRCNQGGFGEAPKTTQKQRDAEDKVIIELSKDVSQQVQDSVGKEIEDLCQKHPHAMNRPVTEDLDKLDKMDSKAGSAECNKFDEDAKRQAGPMRQRLAQLLQSESKSWWQGGKSRGQPDPRRLAQLATKTSDRVLRTRCNIPSPNTACYLMIDGSGSMYGAEMRQACMAAAAFASVLDLCRHKSAVSAFIGSTTAGHYVDRYGQGRMARAGLRYHGVQFAGVKSWSDTYRMTLPNFFRLCDNSGGGTPLGEAIMFAGDELIRRHEKRRIAMIFTDGQPNNQAYCKWACGHLEKIGIEVVLIGIGCDAVANLHNRTAVVRSGADLASTTIVELTKALRPQL